MSTIPASIFKAYDIRGTVPDEVNEEVAERVGRAVVCFTKARTVVVGRDMRTNSPALAAAVIRGVVSQGADVVDIGLATTPMFNVAVASEPQHEAGIMVTASHNPAQYNGFKMDHGDALPIGLETGMSDIARLVTAGEFPAVAKPGTVTGRSYRDAYLARVTTLLDPASLPPFCMVVCCGNGMGGHTMPTLAPRIPGTVIPLHWDLDGTFPNHEANPIKPENVTDVGAAVRNARADIGFAYDGDADRIGVVDERGDLVRGDLVAVLLAREVLRERGGGQVLCDVRASRVCAEEVAAAGGASAPTRVGHALIKKHLRDVGAVFAGELSGHFYFANVCGVECTEYAMLMLLRILARARKPLSEIVASLRRTGYSGEVNFTVQDKDAVLAEINARYASRARSVSTLDGLSFDMGEWWFIVRPSNTEPLLRLIVEAPTDRDVAAHVAELRGVIEGGA